MKSILNNLDVCELLIEFHQHSHGPRAFRLDYGLRQTIHDHTCHGRTCQGVWSARITAWKIVSTCYSIGRTCARKEQELGHVQRLEQDP